MKPRWLAAQLKSGILKKYAKFCKALGENPDQQLDQLMTKGPPTPE
jgi:hypothetical protein